MLSEVAKEMQCYVIGGSIPERDSGKLYNTSTSFGPDGAMLAKHRKVNNCDKFKAYLCFRLQPILRQLHYSKVVYIETITIVQSN